MLTRCPYCGATFRVTPDQLKVRQGQVRCGQCRRVFDALRGLVNNGSKTPTPAPLTPRETERPFAVEEPPKVDEPLKVEEPPKVEEPAKVDEPLEIEEPPKVDEPAKVDEPLEVEGPPKVDEPHRPDVIREAVTAPPSVPGLSWTIVVPAPPGARTLPDPVAPSDFAFMPTRPPRSEVKPGFTMPTDFERMTEPSPTSAFETFKLAEPELPATDVPRDTARPGPKVAPLSTVVSDESPEPKIEPHLPPEFDRDPEEHIELEGEPDFEPVHFNAGPPTILDLHEEAPHEPRRWPWVVASVLAAILLAAQLLLHYRTEAMVAAPGTRPVFVAVCGLIGCQIALPHKIDLIGIESSDLAPDAQKPGTLYLALTLRNRASYAQTWPHLEITLTDAQERPLLRRTLAPDEYLPPQSGLLTSGFARRSEQPVQLMLSATDVPAVGYRLYVYYP